MSHALEEKKHVAFVSVLAAVFLTGSKILVGVLTGSLGILSEAIHSGLDLVAAVITYFAVKISDQQADDNHHYGHGKVENLSAFFETLLLLVTCAWIMYEAIYRLWAHQTHIQVTIWSYAVVIVSIVIDVTRSRALMKAAKKHNSQALEADALHFSTDVWSSAVVLVGLIFANFGWFFADSVAALVVAGIVIVVSVRLGKRSIDVLLDTAPKGLANQIAQLLKEYPDIKSFSAIKIRNSGADIFVDLSIQIDSGKTIAEFHCLSDEVEKHIETVIPRITVHVHPEPD